MVTGVGGGIYDNEPLVEYTFNNNQVTAVKPNPPQTNKPPKPAKPVKAEGLLEMITEKPFYDDDDEVKAN